MTTMSMKSSAVQMINGIDNNNTMLIKQIWEYLTAVVQHHNGETMPLSDAVGERKKKLHSLAGAFNISDTADWKQEKENYLREKYGE